MFGKQARLSEAKIAKILQEAKPLPHTPECFQYAGHQCQFIIEAMAQFKLCFRLNGEQRIWIVPSLLPSAVPPEIHHYGIDQAHALAYKMEFKQFVPRHVIPQLIVDRNQEIKDDVVWQYGVLLEDKLSCTFAWVQVKYAERTIFIWLQGLQAQDYLAGLRRNLVQSLNKLNLHWEEFCACLCLPYVIKLCVWWSEILKIGHHCDNSKQIGGMDIKIISRR